MTRNDVRFRDNEKSAIQSKTNIQYKSSSGSPQHGRNDILPSLLDQPRKSVGKLKQPVKQVQTERDKLRVRTKILQNKQHEERDKYNVKKLAMLDNLIEIHMMMKMYQDTMHMEKDIGAFNRVNILNQIWNKLCISDGSLQPYIVFLQQEIMKFVITKDEKLIQCITKIPEINEFQSTVKAITEKRILTFTEACEILQAQVEGQFQKLESSYSTYKGELHRLKSQLESERQTHKKEIGEIRQQLAKQIEDHDIKEKQLISRVQLQDQDHQQLIQQIQELKDIGYKNKDRFEQEKVSLIRESQNSIRELNIKLFEAKVENSDQKEMISKLREMGDQYRDKFMIAFTSMKTSTERIHKLESDKMELISERSALNVRAMSTFEELTPRPNLQPILDYLRVDERLLRKKSTKETLNLIYKQVTAQISKLQAELEQEAKRKVRSPVTRPTQFKRQQTIESSLPSKKLSFNFGPNQQSQQTILRLNTGEEEG